MVLAAMLLRAPARPLSRTAAATSASDGATVGDGRPASWRLASIAFLTSSRKAEERSSTIWAIAKENQKKETKLKRKEKCQNQRKMRKEETEIKVRYSDTFTGNNTKKKNSKEKQRKNANMVSIKSIQHLRQKVADTVLDKRKACK